MFEDSFNTINIYIFIKQIKLINCTIKEEDIFVDRNYNGHAYSLADRLNMPYLRDLWKKLPTKQNFDACKLITKDLPDSILSKYYSSALPPK